RQQGYRVLRSTAVSNLLALAASETGGAAGGITDEEIDATLARMIRSPDPAIGLRAIETREKRLGGQQATRAAAAQEPSLEDAMKEAIESAPVFGAAFLAEMFLTQHTGLPLGSAAFCQAAKDIARRFPDIWQSWKQIHPGHDEFFDNAAR